MMSYKESFYTLARCLTLGVSDVHLDWFTKSIQNEEIKWDQIVQISTSQFVFPALYSNLKKRELLSLLQKDLVAYMEHIASLNRERNEAIIEQAEEINTLLTAHAIQPTFLKGTANILQNLYEDITERMVGDIDFVVPIEDYEKAYTILMENGYDKVHQTKYDYPSFKHFPRLQHPNYIAAAEVHKEILVESHASEFNYNTISKDVFITLEGYQVMSYAHQLTLSILAHQVNDDGMYYKKVNLRNAYDVLILSQKTDSLEAISQFDKLFHPLNNYIATCVEIFGEIPSLKSLNTKQAARYVKKVNYLISNPEYNKKHTKRIGALLFLKYRLSIILKAFYKRNHRVWLFRRITDKDWWKEKMIQLGIKSAPEES